MSEERKIKNIAEYLKEVSKIKEGWSTPVLAFRGQENAEWRLTSSAERRLQASPTVQDRVATGSFIEYHQNLLARCKLKNYHQREGKPLDDLELLADLQHHGAATCLLDFTRNSLVALWFACEKSDAAGKVFVVNTADEKIFLEIMPADIANRSISDILEFKTRETGKDQADEPQTRKTVTTSLNEPNCWYWPPAHLNERITAQHSLFLFGSPSSMELQLKPEEIVIESASKEQIRRELKELHDIHEESLFPDFIGFAYTQRHDVPYGTLGAEEYLRRGAEALQRGQYSEAIESCTKVIERNPDYARAYSLRGVSYDSRGEYDKAIQNYTEAIKLEPQVPDFYYLRGVSYDSLGEYEKAIQDYTKMISLKPRSRIAYYERGIARLHLREWEKAMSDLTTAENMGADIAALFHADGKSAAAFERKIGVKLPGDIAAMLTENGNES